MPAGLFGLIISLPFVLSIMDMMEAFLVSNVTLTRLFSAHTHRVSQLSDHWTGKREPQLNPFLLEYKCCNRKREPLHPQEASCRYVPNNGSSNPVCFILKPLVSYYVVVGIPEFDSFFVAIPIPYGDFSSFSAFICGGLKKWNILVFPLPLSA